MSLPNYSTWTDQELLVSYTEGLMNAFTDTEGDDDTRWQAAANAAIERTPLMVELVKRKRKWRQPIPPPPPGTLPDAVPIANPDKLAIVSGSSPNWTYQNA